MEPCIGIKWSCSRPSQAADGTWELGRRATPWVFRVLGFPVLAEFFGVGFNDFTAGTMEGPVWLAIEFDLFPYKYN
jgi:hypothetical protein